MALSLTTLRSAIATDPGLLDTIDTTQLNAGLRAVDSLTQVLLQVIQAQNLNADGLITEADLMAVSQAVRADPALLARFIAAHGDDDGGSETGYHLLQNDGGSLLFQGENFLDTVADAIFHFGFPIEDGHFLNEDGNANEDVSDVAGWLNFFLNGRNVVFGTEAADMLHSGEYSPELSAAANETWYAGGGADQVWAGQGDDTVWAGLGDDKVGGSYGNDSLLGEAGNDTLWGDQGRDRLDGGSGDDDLGGGSGSDTLLGSDGNDALFGEGSADSLVGDAGDDQLYGGALDDTLSGGTGNDSLFGETGNDLIKGSYGTDSMSGGDGADRIYGGSDADTISGGEGADLIDGGSGADRIYLWESVQSNDTLVFHTGDSGRSKATIDVVEGFTSGTDHIDLRDFAGMVFEDLDFTGGGTASCYYDGKYLRIDTNGDGVSNMIVQFRYVAELQAGDFQFA